MTAIDKREVLAALRERVARDLEDAVASQRHAQQSATHEEARPESDKDTRATETSYLARGLAMRVAELTEASRLLEAMELPPKDGPIRVGSLVSVSDADTGAEARYFIAPAGAGVALELDGASIAVITPRAPLCRAMLGKQPGDEIEFVAPRGTRVLEIEDVS